MTIARSTTGATRRPVVIGETAPADRPERAGQRACGNGGKIQGPSGHHDTHHQPGHHVRVADGEVHQSHRRQRCSPHGARPAGTHRGAR